MRVIAGRYKGRILRSVKDQSVRPATDRVKESIFNILQNRLDLRGTKVLDLFAGSGSLGFEALSRGAANVVFVENSIKSIRSIKENINRLQCEVQCEVVKMEAQKFLSTLDETFDLIFADPPYEFSGAENLPHRIFQRRLVVPHGYVIMEHRARLSFTLEETFEFVLHRKFGNTVVSFFTPKSPTTN